MTQAKRAATAAILALTALAASAVPAAAVTHEVNPGESIQAAIDAASPGDTVLVHAGTYSEYLQIIDKDRITLKGENATLKPPATVTDTLCNASGDITGICVAGQIDLAEPDNPKVIRESRGDRITGFTISGFKNNGIFGFGTHNLRIANNTFTHNGEYGVFSNTSTGTHLVRNVARQNEGEAGFYVGDSPKARAVVSRNRAINNHGYGIFVRDASHGVLRRNVVKGNCAGIFVLADAPGPANDWRITRNRVNANNKACEANEEEQAPATSGQGIVLSGVRHVRVIDNTVRGNRKLHPTEASGGILLVRGDGPNGTTPLGVIVRGNRAFGNDPFDISWDGSGQATFRNNRCGKGSPASICS